jgi:hypothetical protein
MIGRKALNNLRGRAQDYHDAWKRAARGEQAAVANFGRLSSKHDALTRVVAEYIVASRANGVPLAKQVAAAGVDLSIEYTTIGQPLERDPVDGGQAGPMPLPQALALAQETVRVLTERLAELQAANESAHGFPAARTEVAA